jgi:hypothetical protein
MLPYTDFKDALYEDRIEFPEYMVKMRRGDTRLTEVAYKEISELMETGVKIEHPPQGSKDVADCMAGVTYTLMGDRAFRRKVVSISEVRDMRATGTEGQMRSPLINAGALPSPIGSLGALGAPMPPSRGRDPWSGRLMP